MKHTNMKRTLAGLMSLAMIAQAVPAIQSFTALTAAAAVSVDSIQTRVFEYDFGSFKALYDTRTKRWFDEKGKTLIKQESKTQTAGAPEGVLGKDVGGLVLNPAEQSLMVQMSDGTVTYTKDIISAEDEASIKQLLAYVHAVKPEYSASYYDRAQQKNVEVPEPASFPLIYQWGTAVKDGESFRLSCRIYFGEVLYGTATLQGGKISFTRAGDENDAGEANPFTSAGDATVDGRVDVSDAVLSSRLLAEDTAAPVTSLGSELADKNEDGALTGRDVTEILFDIVKTPTANRGPVSPAGTSAVVGLEQVSGALSDDTAKLFGFADLKAFTADAAAENGAGFRAYTHCEQVGLNDVWDIVYFDRGGCKWNQFDVKGLYLSADGVLTVAADFYENETTAAAASAWTHLRLTVPHGELPQKLTTAWNLTEVRQPKQTASAVSYIVRDRKAEHTVPVQRLVQSLDDEDAMAKAIGYKDAAAFNDALTEMNTNVHRFAKCTEGAQFDTWNLVYAADDEASWQNDAVRSLELTPGGKLVLGMDLTTDSAVKGGKRRFAWTQLTVPHGTLAANSSRLFVDYQVKSYDAPVETQTVRSLSVSEMPQRAVPLLNVENTAVKAIDIPTYLIKYGLDAYVSYERGEPFRNDYPGGRIPWRKTEVESASGEITDQYSFLLAIDSEFGGYDQMNLKSLALTADHKLQVVTEYTFDKYHFSFGQSDNQFDTEITITVPHGALPEDLEIKWTNEKCAGSMLFTPYDPEYIPLAPQKPYTESESTFADVQIDSDTTGAIIPAALRSRLDAGQVDISLIKEDHGVYQSAHWEVSDNADYAWEYFTEPEDTNVAAIRALLEDNRDVAAVYYKRGTEDKELCVDYAKLIDGTLSLKLDGSYDQDAAAVPTYYRVLISAPDGTLPQVQALETEFSIGGEPADYYTSEPFISRQQKRYAEIHFTEPQAYDEDDTPAEDPYAPVPYSDQSVMQVIATEPIEIERADSTDWSSARVETDTGKAWYKNKYGIEADWSSKDVFVLTARGYSDERFAVAGVSVNKEAELTIEGLKYTSIAQEADDYYETHSKQQQTFLIVLDHGVLPEKIEDVFESCKYFSTYTAWDEDENEFICDELPDFEAAAAKAPVLSIAPQEKRVYARGEAGSVVKHTTDLLTDNNGNLLEEKAPIYTVVPAGTAENFMTVEGAANKLTYRKAAPADLNGADLLLIGFRMEGRVTECGLNQYNNYVDTNGVLHLNAAVFHDTTKTELADSNAACVLGIAVDHDAVAEITGVVFDTLSEFAGDPAAPAVEPEWQALGGSGSAYADFLACVENEGVKIRFKSTDD